MILKSAFLFFILGFGMMTLANPAGMSSLNGPQSKLKLADSKKKHEKKESSPKGFNLNTTLSTRTDLADDKPERSYSHSMRLGAGYDSEKFSLSAGTAYSYVSLNTDIVERKYKSDGLSDTTLGVSFLERYTFSGSLPTSEASQHEGLLGSVTLSAEYKHDLENKSISLNHSLNYDYLFNTYLYSPISNKSTYEMSLSYSLGISAQIISQFSIAAGFTGQTQRLNDGSIELGSNINSSFNLKTGYKLGNLSFNLGYGSGNFFDDKFQNNWFLNQYQQVISVGVGYKWL